MRWWEALGVGLLCAPVPFVVSAVCGVLVKGCRECYHKRMLPVVDWLYLVVGLILTWKLWL